MKCSSCGFHNEDGSKFCAECGQKMDMSAQPEETFLKVSLNEKEDAAEKKNFTESERDDISEIKRYSSKIICPRCGGERLQVVTENSTTTVNSGGGYSAGKGCLGWILLGPFGLLCGNCGNSQNTTVTSTSKTYWVCSDCGNKFRNLDDLKKEIEHNKKSYHYLLWYGIIVAIVSLPFIGYLPPVGWLFLFLSAIGLTGAFFTKQQIDKCEKEYDELERTSKK